MVRWVDRYNFDYYYLALSLYSQLADIYIGPKSCHVMSCLCADVKMLKSAYHTQSYLYCRLLQTLYNDFLFALVLATLATLVHRFPDGSCDLVVRPTGLVVKHISPQQFVHLFVSSLSIREQHGDRLDCRCFWCGNLGSFPLCREL